MDPQGRLLKVDQDLLDQYVLKQPILDEQIFLECSPKKLQGNYQLVKYTILVTLGGTE